MLFYRIRGDFIDKEQAKNIDDYSIKRTETKKLKEKTRKFNQNTNDYIFVEDINTDELSIFLGAITENDTDLEVNVRKYISLLRLNVEITDLYEITFQEFCDDIEESEYTNRTSDRMFDKFGMNGFRPYNYYHYFNEEIINVDTYDDIEKTADDLSLKETLNPELKRIGEGKSKTKANGHPVHYTIESDDQYTINRSYFLLVKQLYRFGRIKSKRISTINLSPRYDASRGNMSFENIYKINSCGVVVVQFRNGDIFEDDISSSVRKNIEDICRSIKRHSDEVLTILSLPKECTKIKELLYEQLGTMSFVEIKEEFISTDEAKLIFKRMAKEKHVRIDKKLLNYLDDNNSYLLRELNEYFEEWYRAKLKYTVYPQYKNINSLKKNEAESKHKGVAYEQLEEMIGLAEAKKVINNALDFYKAKKLFESKGLMQNTPSMHMVFTGNPGTAKTSVARLFAEIMRDNKVLSNGNLVEVGRSDLVGKYVGWTAPTVKKKFQEAKGASCIV